MASNSKNSLVIILGIALVISVGFGIYEYSRLVYMENKYGTS